MNLDKWPSKLWYPGEPVPDLAAGQHERLPDGWEESLWIPEGAGLWWYPIQRFLSIANLLVWPDGFNAGENVTFDAWQLVDLIIPMHGLYWNTDAQEHYMHEEAFARPIPQTRVVRELLLLIGRGAGKSAWASVEALVETIDSSQRRSDVGLYASSKEQATILYQPIVHMVQEAPEQIKDRLKIYAGRKSIVSNVDGSAINVHTGEATREVGRKHTTAFIDELLSQKNGELFATVKTSAGKRPNCRFASMTTPSLDDSPELFARIEVEKAEAVASHRASKPSLLPVIYQASTSDDPFSWDTVRKACPHLDCGRLDPQVIRDEMEDARRFPSNLAAFKVFRLCLWGEGGDLFIPLHDFDACAASDERPLPDLSELAKMHCGIGLDLSRTTDLTCISLMFWDEEKDHLYLLWHHFCSEATFKRLDAWTGGRMKDWKETGAVKIDVTGSERIDHDMVQAALFKYVEKFDAELGIDRYDAYSTFAIAEKRGVKIQPLRQGAGLAHGIKLVEQQIIDRGITHNGDPLARWCLQNAEVRYNSEGWAFLVRQSDRRSTKIIDPAVAAVMAADRIIFIQNELAKAREYAIAQYEEPVLDVPIIKHDNAPTVTAVEWDMLEEL